jgi:hypothetical protein
MSKGRCLMPTKEKNLGTEKDDCVERSLKASTGLTRFKSSPQLQSRPSEMPRLFSEGLQGEAEAKVQLKKLEGLK